MSRFELHAPASIPEAVSLGARFGDDARFLAGGTDLLIQIQRGRIAPRHVVALHRVPGLDTLSVNGSIVIGAGVTHRRIEKMAAFRGALAGLIEGGEVIGGHQVRNVATVGGNIVNASPAADLVPVLMTLDAAVTLVGAQGERTLPLGEFLLGPGHTARRPDELLVRVTMPGLAPRTGTAFVKAGRRRAMEISVACVAVRVTLDASRASSLDARIALGAVAPTTIRATAAAHALAGQPLSAETLKAAGVLAAEACDPISDVRASADFRRHLIKTLVPRALSRAAERARAT